MPLNFITVSAGNVFEERLRPRNYYLGLFIREYVTSGKELRVNPNVIQEIVYKFTKAGDNSDLHKVRLTNGKDFLVNDAGLGQLDA